MQFLRSICCCAILFAALAGQACADTAKTSPVRVGLTPRPATDDVSFVARWQGYLEQRLHRRVTIVQRETSHEIVQLLRNNNLDFAWVNGSSYVAGRRRLKLVAVPLFHGKPQYQAYLIVPASDTSTRSLFDLRGKIFAYSDPESSSGYLYTRYTLIRRNEKPDTFFTKTFFTGGHGKVVDAVAVGLAQGAAVDSYVLDTLGHINSGSATRIRVVEKSPPFGLAPIVALDTVPPELFSAMQHALLDMKRDGGGAMLLAGLNLDGFIAGDPSLFDSIAQMRETIRRTP